MLRRVAIAFLLSTLLTVASNTAITHAQTSRTDAISAGDAWSELQLVGQRKTTRQLTCRYARTGQVRRQLLKQEAVVVFRVPKGKAVSCPRPTPGRTSLARLTSSMRNHPTMGKLLMRVSLLPIRKR